MPAEEKQSINNWQQLEQNPVFHESWSVFITAEKHPAPIEVDKSNRGQKIPHICRPVDCETVKTLKQFNWVSMLVLTTDAHR